jgi:hypothetical protein
MRQGNADAKKCDADTGKCNKNTEISYHTLRFIVGFMAIALASLTSLTSQSRLDSISEAYWDPGHWPRNIFVGFLFAISAFLFAYNGEDRLQKYLSKLAAVATLGVALFPCGCKCHEEIVSGVHYVSAAIMFGILLVFCYFFYENARKKETADGNARSVIYGLCAAAILVAISGMVVDFAFDDILSKVCGRFTFFAEMTGLVAFGIAWLVASRAFPYITNEDDRVSLF